ncbi:MAG: hypothetical protein OEU68_04065 [Nitrospira sp.]|nr:hypothetical protein [Nitrospira sp.]MDH4242679.1 hypothetical protein [Nitrospira sp.]MDH4355052.1 hypothetical protein [Nitrospira sp.]MDH5316962.1 hypothetical protein [Nitrospira sp.]
MNCNPLINVENTTDEKLMVAQVPANAAPVTKAGSLDDAYALALTALPAGSAVQTFSADSKGTVNVKVEPAAKAEDIEADLIAMTVDYLMPAVRATETAAACKDKTGKCAGAYDCSFPTPLTATNDTVAAMKSSLDFYRLLVADPTANSAVKFTALVNAVKDGTTDPLALPAQVDAFFKSLSAPLSACTFDSFATASTYAQNYAPVWANLSSSYSYNLFTPSDTSTPTKPAWKKIGSILFTKTRTAALTDKSAGYDITYTDGAGKTTSLTMQDGMFVTKENPDLSTIQLKGAFKVKSDITLVASDNILIPVLIGQIGSTSVMAAPLDTPAEGVQTPWWDLANSFWAKELLAVLGLIAAVAGFILLVYKFGAYVQSKTKKAKTKEEKQKIKDDAIDALSDLIADRQKLLDKSGIGGRIPKDGADFKGKVGSLKDRALNNNADRQKQLLDDAIYLQRSMITELSKYSVSRNLEEAMDLLREAKSQIGRVKDWNSLQKVRTEIVDAISSSAQSIDLDVQAKSDVLSKESLKMLDKTRNDFADRAIKVAEAGEYGERMEEGSEQDVVFGE